MNRPDGAGASWTDEEDKQLDEEYNSGMKISEIARVHEQMVLSAAALPWRAALQEDAYLAYVLEVLFAMNCWTTFRKQIDYFEVLW